MKDGVITVVWQDHDNGATSTKTYGLEDAPYSVKKMIAESLLREVGINLTIHQIEDKE